MRWGLVSLAGLLVVAGIWMCWPVAPTAVPGPAERARPTEVVGEQSSTTAHVAAGGRSSAPRSDAQLPGVYGRLLDARGEPLPGFRVWFHKVGNYGGERVAADEEGAYAFKVVEAGEYELATDPYGLVSKKLTLEVDQRIDFDLRLPDSFVATTGRLIRGGKPQKMLQLWRRRDDDEWQRSSANEVYRIVLPAGPNTMGVVNRSSLTRPDLPSVEHVLHIPSGVALFDWTILVPASDLHVTVHDKMGLAVEDAKVTIRYLSDGVGEHTVSRPTAAKGCWFSFLAAGKYEVSVQGEELVDVPVQEITIAQVDRREHLHFVTPRAVTVRLLLRHGRRELRSMPPANMPLLRGVDHQGQPHDYSYERKSGSSWDRARERAGYFGVPPGEVTVVAEDQLIDREWRYLGFDAVGEHVVHAAAAAPNTLELSVIPRARVDLRACHKSGREQLSASIEVFAGEHRVHNGADGGCQRFFSYLPPGDYRIVVDRGGDKREHALRVDRRDIRLRLRP